MCMRFGGPPYGIPIPQDIHDQYPGKIKKAWEVFDKWWQKAQKSGGPIRRSDMPKGVTRAMQDILEAPIPGHDGATGADSCYMIGVQAQLAD